MPQHVKLYGGKDRDEAHKRLAEILAHGEHPAAECREDPNDRDHPYQVWSGPLHPHERVPPPETKSA